MPRTQTCPLVLIPRMLLRTSAGDGVDCRATPSLRRLIFDARGSEDLGFGDPLSLSAVVLRGYLLCQDDAASTTTS
jgi:hypothetical protein